MVNERNLYKRNIYLDYIAIFIRNLNLTHGVWMAYLFLEKEMSYWQLGLLEGIFHIGSISMEVPTGMIADLVGRKFSRVLSIFFMVIYIILILFGTEFWVLALGFFLCGTSYAFESGSGDAIVYDSLIELNKEETFMKVQGIKEILFQVSSSIALFIGGYIAVERYELNYQIMILVFIIALIPILLMKEIRVNVVEKGTSIKQLIYEHFINSTVTVFRSKKLRNLILVDAMILAPITVLFFYLQTYLLDLEFSISHVGIILGIHSIAGAVGGYAAHKLERKFKEKLILYFVPIFIVFCFWALLIDSIVYIPFVLLGLLDSIFYVVLTDYINRQIPSSQRATVISFSNLAFSVIMILIFPLVGFVGEFSTLRIAFILLASIVTISYIALLFILNKASMLRSFS